MLSNAYLLAKIGADTAENEQHFAENLPIGRRVARPALRLREVPPHRRLHVAALDFLAAGEPRSLLVLIKRRMTKLI